MTNKCFIVCAGNSRSQKWNHFEKITKDYFSKLKIRGTFKIKPQRSFGLLTIKTKKMTATHFILSPSNTQKLLYNNCSPHYIIGSCLLTTVCSPRQLLYSLVVLPHWASSATTAGISNCMGGLETEGFWGVYE